MKDRNLEPLELSEDSFLESEHSSPNCWDKTKKFKRSIKNPNLVLTVLVSMIIIIFALKYHYSNPDKIKYDSQALPLGGD
jgi:hypothetical protein